MNTNRASRIAEIDRKFMWQGIYNLPGIFSVAGGLQGKFGEPDEIPFQFLTDSTITTALLVFGAASFLWFSFTIISLTKEKIRLRDGRTD